MEKTIIIEKVSNGWIVRGIEQKRVPYSNELREHSLVKVARSDEELLNLLPAMMKEIEA